MISEYYSDEELISELRSFFTIDEAENIDFETYLGQLTEVDEETWSVNIKGRTFTIDKTFCSVSTEDEEVMEEEE